jgi:hypothetical protein
MDRITFRFRDCCVLCVVRRTEAAMDASRLCPFSVFLLVWRDKSSIREPVCPPQPQVGCEVDYEYTDRAPCGRSGVAEHGGTLFSRLLFSS